MLKSLRRLLSLGGQSPAVGVFETWAGERGHAFRRVRDAEGCVVEGRMGAQPWRIEWGVPQRNYIVGHELRLMAEFNLPKDLQVLVLNRHLMEAMEKAVYEQYVDDVQTRIDTETPSEMRWLVLYHKLPVADMGRLRDRYGAVASALPWAQQWLASPLNDALAASLDQVDEAHPVVLTIGRGRLTLRTALDTPDVQQLAQWVSVFEHALREARRLGDEWRDASGSGQTTQPSLWEHIGPTDPDDTTQRLPPRG